MGSAPDAPAAEFLDPFGATSDPAAYVPRPGTERVLDDLIRQLLEGASGALLVGEAGVGKSLLLRVLEERLRTERLAVYLPYPALPLDGLFAWAGVALGLPPGDDPVAALTERARRGCDARPGLVLLLDDMADVPDATLLELASLVEDGDGLFQVAGAVDPAGACLVADLWPELGPMRFVNPMSPDELRSYLETHLARADLPGWGEAPLAPDLLAGLFESTAGVASQVNAEALRIYLRSQAAATASPQNTTIGRDSSNPAGSTT